MTVNAYNRKLPGLNSFLSGNAGSNLIVPPDWKGTMTAGLITREPKYDIRAGVVYLLTRMALFSDRHVITGWRPFTTAMVARRYNGGGDPDYARKLEHA